MGAYGTLTLKVDKQTDRQIGRKYILVDDQMDKETDGQIEFRNYYTYRLKFFKKNLGPLELKVFHRREAWHPLQHFSGCLGICGIRTAAHPLDSHVHIHGIFDRELQSKCIRNRFVLLSK